MKIRKIEVKNMDDGTMSPAQQLICDCGSESFIVYSLGEGHTHLQCERCETPHCSQHPPEMVEDVPIQQSEESEGFSE